MLLQLMNKISSRQKKLLFWFSFPVVALAITVSSIKTFVYPNLGYKQGLVLLGTGSTELTIVGTDSSKEIECIEIDYPAEIEMDSSKTIRLSLLRMSVERLVSRYKDRKPEIKKAHDVPEGTFTVPFEDENKMIRIGPLLQSELSFPLKDAYGQEYKAEAKAALITTAFDSKSDIPPEEAQSLEPAEVTWQWAITPKQVNTQSLFITILLEWKNKNDGELIQRRIRTDNFDIRAYKPFLTTGQVNLAAILVGLIGSGLSFPWLYDRYKERKNRRPPHNIGYVRPREGGEASQSNLPNVKRGWFLRSRLVKSKLRRDLKSK